MLLHIHIGFVGENPKAFVRNILDFELRGLWESMYEDGVLVEDIDIGEVSCS